MKIFPEKLAKKLPEGFSDTVSSMSEEEIHKKIIEYEGNMYNIQDDLENNNKITDAKRELKEMTDPYRERKAEENAKIIFCLHLLEGRGAEIGVREEDSE